MRLAALVIALAAVPAAFLAGLGLAYRAEAVAKFGTIRWSADGLHAGDYFLPRERLQSHR